MYEILEKKSHTSHFSQSMGEIYMNHGEQKKYVHDLWVDPGDLGVLLSSEIIRTYVRAVLMKDFKMMIKKKKKRFTKTEGSNFFHWCDYCHYLLIISIFILDDIIIISQRLLCSLYNTSIIWRKYYRGIHFND